MLYPKLCYNEPCYKEAEVYLIRGKLCVLRKGLFCANVDKETFNEGSSEI